MKYVTYFESGEIESYGETQDELQAIMEAERPRFLVHTLEALDAQNFYVDLTGIDPEIVARPDMDTVATFTNSGSTWLADGTDTITYGTGLPDPTAVLITCDNPYFPEQTGEVDDGTLTLTTTAVGKYFITLTAFPYKVKTIMVDAV